MTIQYIDTLPVKLKRAKKIPTQARSKATVVTILSTAKQIIVNEGVQTLTTNKIAEQSGVTVGSIYQYFEDKEAIIYEIFSHWLESYVEKYKEYAQAQNNDDVFEFFWGVFELFLADADNNMQANDMLRQLDIVIQTSEEIQELDEYHTQQFCEVLLKDSVRLGLVEDNTEGRKAVRFGFLMILQATEVLVQADINDRHAYISYIKKMLKIWLESLNIR